MVTRTATKPHQSEKALQADIVTHLFLLGHTVYQFGRPGGRPKCPKCNAWVGRLSGAMPKGWLDLLVIDAMCLPPVVTFLEVKTPKGKLSQEQEWMIRELQDMGCRVAVVRSVKEAERAVAL